MTTIEVLTLLMLLFASENFLIGLIALIINIIKNTKK